MYLFSKVSSLLVSFKLLLYVYLIIFLLASCITSSSSTAVSSSSGAWYTRNGNYQRTSLSSNIGSKTGKLKWRFQTNRYVFSSPTIDTENSVYFGSGDNYIRKVNISTGTLIWQYLTNGEVHSSATFGSVVSNTQGMLYIGSNDYNLYCLNSTTGALIWTYTTNEAILSAPSLYKDTVTISSNDKYLYAINARTGQLRWKFTTGYHSSSAVVSDYGYIYLATVEHKVYCLDFSTQNIVWTYTSNDICCSGEDMSIGQNGTMVYISSHLGVVYALDAFTGAKIWSSGVQSQGQYFAPSIDKRGRVYVGTMSGHIYCFEGKTGTLLWSKLIGGSIGAAITIDLDGYLYVGNGVAGSNRFYALDNNGNIVWSYSTDGHLPGSTAAIANDGTVIIGTYGGSVYAFLDELPDLPVFPNTVNPIAQPGRTMYTWVCTRGYYGIPLTWVWNSTLNTWEKNGGAPTMNCRPCPMGMDGYGGNICSVCPFGTVVTVNGCQRTGPRNGLVFEFTADSIDSWPQTNYGPVLGSGLTYAIDRHGQGQNALNIRSGSSLTIDMSNYPLLPTGANARTISAWFKYSSNQLTDNGSIISWGKWKSTVNPGTCTLKRIIGQINQPFVSGDGGLAVNAFVNWPLLPLFGPDGSLYFCEYNYHRVRRIDKTTGIVTTFAGDGSPGSGKVSYPRGLAFDKAGNLYISCTETHQIIKRSPDGTLTIFAGTGVKGETGDGGLATQATITDPAGIVVDSKGNVYFVSSVKYIRRVDTNGIIERFAGNGVDECCNCGGIDYACFKRAEGRSGSSALDIPMRWIAIIIIDPDDVIYASDTLVWRIHPNGTAFKVSALSPSNTLGILSANYGMALDASGNILMSLGSWIRTDDGSSIHFGNAATSANLLLDTSGPYTKIAGNGNYGSSDGSQFTSQFAWIHFGTIDVDGSFVFSDLGDGTNIRRLDGTCLGTDQRNGRSGLRIRGGNINPGIQDISGPIAPLSLPSSSIGNGQWHHIAIAYDGKVRRAYIDGKHIISTPTVLNTAEDGTLWIGNAPDGFGNEFFHGSIDDIRIYNRSLTVNEIQLLASPSLPSFTTTISNPNVDQVYTQYTWKCTSGYTGEEITWTWNTVTNEWNILNSTSTTEGVPVTNTLEPWIHCALPTPSATPSGTSTSTSSASSSSSSTSSSTVSGTARMSVTASGSSTSSASSSTLATSTASSTTSSTATSSTSATSTASSTTSSTATSTASSTTSSTAISSTSATSTASSPTSSIATSLSSSLTSTPSSTEMSISTVSRTPSPTNVSSTPSASPLPGLRLSFGLSNINVTDIVQKDNIHSLESAILTMAGTGVTVVIVTKICTVVPRTCPYDVTQSSNSNRRLQREDYYPVPIMLLENSSRSRRLQNSRQYVDITADILCATAAWAASLATSLSSTSNTSAGWTSNLLSTLVQMDPGQYGSSTILPITTSILSSSSNNNSAVLSSSDGESNAWLGTTKQNLVSTIIVMVIGIGITLFLVGVIVFVRSYCKKQKHKSTVVVPAAVAEVHSAVASSISFFSSKVSTTNDTRSTSSSSPTASKRNTKGEICHNCRTVFLPNSSFCTCCGKPRVTSLRCSKCNISLPLNARFCAQCGTQTETVDSSINGVPLAEGSTWTTVKVL